MVALRRLVAVVTNAAVIAAIVVGPPLVFVRFGAASALRQVAELRGAADGRLSTQEATGVILLPLVVSWLLLVAALLFEASARVRGVKAPRLPFLLPLQGVAAMLIAGQAASLLTPAVAAAGPPAVPADAPHGPPAGAVATHATLRHGPVTVLVADTRYTYRVRRGDSLSKIAKAWLGEADRWPQICHLNKHRHFPKVGGTLHDCDLIYPGWDLRLPADARPPRNAVPVTPPTTPTPPVAAGPSAAPSLPASPYPSLSQSTAAGNPVDVPTGPPSSEPVSPWAVPWLPVSVSPRASGLAVSEPPPSASPADNDAERPVTDGHGVQLTPSSWLPWGLAIMISAAAVLVWLQRRRRYTGEPDDDPPTVLPEPVVKLRRAVARSPKLVLPGDQDEEPPALVSGLAPLLPGGTGITGDGATAAARAALVAVLASGSPHHPDTRGEVVIDAATLATLLGSDVAALGAWPRLHVADSVDDALTVIESRLLHRSRILDEHALTDLDELRRRVPDEEALPPILLLTQAPLAGGGMRAKVALALGGGLQVTGLLLGEWAHGATIEVALDGHTKLVAGQAAEPVPARLPVLDPAAAIQILTTLREAQTGEPPVIVSPAMPVTVVPLHASRTQATQDEPQQPDTLAAAPITATCTGRAKLRVLGPPRIEDIVHDGRPLRAKAKELAVYLAVHPDGAATKELGDHIELDARISQAAQRVHTNASNLRHVLGRAADPEASNAYVIKSSGRYRLDPATVDVDVWTLRDLMRKATVASGPARRELLTTACDLYTSPLAEGEDYEWLAPHRETVRRWGTEAHLLLADDLLHGHPQKASDLLDKAIDLDRYNEALYVKAMHARHALGDTDGIRTLLRALTKALADLDAEPQDDTRTLAAKLHTSLDPK